MVTRPSMVIRQVLLNEGLCQPSSQVEWRCVTERLPDGVGTLDDMVAIVDRDDVEIGRYYSDSNYRLDPHIQIVVRGLGFDRSYEKMREITDLLDTLHNYQITSGDETYTITGTKRTTNIQFNGIDGTGRRYVHTIEYDLLLV